MFERLLERIAQALDAGAIPYMVIGGQAVLLYGEPRLTKDIDITLGADLLRLRDVLQAMSRVRKVKLGATEVRFAAVEDLLIHKVLAGRPRDLEDAKSVLLKNPRAELAYIRRWLGELATAIDEPLVQRFDQLIEALRP